MCRLFLAVYQASADFLRFLRAEQAEQVQQRRQALLDGIKAGRLRCCAC